MKMNNTKVKRQAFTVGIEINDNISNIKPFKEMPSLNDSGQDCADRMNAHDLFSLYTADIINEDIIYAR